MLARPFVLDAVRLLDREHTGTNQAHYDIGCADYLYSSAA
jgi:hypothetical protein